MAEELGVSCSPIGQPDQVTGRLQGEVRYSSGGLQALVTELTRNSYGRLQRCDAFHPVNSDLLLSREQWLKSSHAFLMLLARRFHNRSQMKTSIDKDVS
jgi:hypothetical protein